jgi:hypothetical protein
MQKAEVASNHYQSKLGYLASHQLLSDVAQPLPKVI